MDGNIPLSDSDFDFFEGLGIFNIDDLETPQDSIEEFAIASPPPPPPPPVHDSAPQSPPPVHDSAPPPPPPVHDSASPPPPPPVHDSAPPPPPNGIAQRLAEAHRLAEEAAVMVNTMALNGSIILNKESMAHLEGCQANITAATKALQLATILLSEATSVNQDESLTELLSDL